MNKLLKLLLAISLAAPVFAQSSGLPSIVPGTIGNCVKIGGNNVATDNGSTCGTGGSAFPLTFVQEATMYTASNVSSFTATFPQAAAASGNTLFMLVATDGNASVTLPTGWTVDINQVQASWSRFVLLHKASASDTSATFALSASSLAIQFFEVAGTHTLDQSSVGGAAGTPNTVTFPAITPTAGSVVFAAACLVLDNASAGFQTPVVPVPSVNAAWGPIAVMGTSIHQRTVAGYVGRVAASHVSTQPPQLNLNGYAIFATGGVAYATFSIL